LSLRYEQYNNLGQLIHGRLVYFRSTDVEQKNYERLLWSVPDEWMYHLSCNKKILLNDISSNHKGKIERIFLPVLSDLLNNILLNKPIKNKQLKQHFELALNEVEKNKSLKTKFIFWKGKIKQEIEIVGKTMVVKKEPNPLSQV
jgi:hypothetical protein